MKIKNFNILEKLRTKEELIKYFKTLGKKITEEELNALKQSYEQIKTNNDALSLDQLDNIAGGMHICINYYKKSGEYTIEFHGDAPFTTKEGYMLYKVPVKGKFLEKSYLELPRSKPTSLDLLYNANYIIINLGKEGFCLCISPDEIRSELERTLTNPEELELNFNSYISRLSKFINAEKFVNEYSDISDESGHPFYDLLQKFNLEAILNFSNGSSELQDS